MTQADANSRQLAAAHEEAAAEAAALRQALEEARAATGGEAEGWKARAEFVEEEMEELRERVSGLEKLVGSYWEGGRKVVGNSVGSWSVGSW